MLFMNCPECETVILDTMASCSYCGYQVITPEENFKKCPCCHSTNLRSTQKGFNVDNAVKGYALFGDAGVLAGHIGSKNDRLHCLHCDHIFKPSDALLSIREINDLKLIDFIRQRNKAAAIQLCCELYNVKEESALNYLKSISQFKGYALGEDGEFYETFFGKYGGLIIFFVLLFGVAIFLACMIFIFNSY